ncbi:aldo/keto reductase, partial [bacterium]|nr:aldo/keto reductase [bacterium]
IQSYCHYCLNDTSLETLLPYLHERGIGIINSAPLAMRLLTDTGAPDWHPAPDELRARCAQAARYCREHGGDIAKLALQFSVRHPGIQTNIVGTANPARIDENMAQIEEPIDENLLQKVLEILRPIHNVTWPQGRPENN